MVFTKRAYRRLRHLDGEERHEDQTTQHKSHIQKVMFVAAIGVPDEEHNFDGKIAIIAVIERGVAQRNSRNRPTGTPIVKNLSLTAEEYLHIMTKPDGIIAKIKERMPWMEGRRIIVQHDGAAPHEGRGNDFFLACSGQRDPNWDIEFITQPAQSPDLNKLDLSIFNSMNHEADIIRGDGETIEQLIASVEEQFRRYDPQKLTRADALLHEIYRQILENDGGNQFDVAHSGIRRRQNAGEDPLDRIVPLEIRVRGEIAHNMLTANLAGDESDDSDDEIDENAP